MITVSFKIMPDLQRKFKAKCALEGTTMQDQIERLMKQYLAEKNESV